MKFLRKIWNALPTQWWVYHDNWYKTTWKYILSGKHKGDYIKLSRP